MTLFRRSYKYIPRERIEAMILRIEGGYVVSRQLVTTDVTRLRKRVEY